MSLVLAAIEVYGRCLCRKAAGRMLGGIGSEEARSGREGWMSLWAANTFIAVLSTVDFFSSAKALAGRPRVSPHTNATCRSKKMKEGDRKLS